MSDKITEAEQAFDTFAANFNHESDEWQDKGVDEPMPISEDDLNYLRNINTRPGPNAGKSIDPTKPGPSDKTDKWDREHVKRRAIVQDEKGRFEAIDKAAFAQSDAEPKGIDLDDADRAYDKWAEHRNGQSRLDAFRAGVEFGLRHTALAQSDASAGLIEAAKIAEEHAGRTAGSTQYVLEYLAAMLRTRAADRSGK
jgi:hypothetical protein